MGRWFHWYSTYIENLRTQVHFPEPMWKAGMLALAYNTSHGEVTDRQIPRSSLAS